MKRKKTSQRKKKSNLLKVRIYFSLAFLPTWSGENKSFHDQKINNKPLYPSIVLLDIESYEIVFGKKSERSFKRLFRFSEKYEFQFSLAKLAFVCISFKERGDF